VDINATKSWKGQNSSVITDFPELFTNEISDKRNPFDVLVLDIDGVLTNGTKLYSLDGTVAGKRYNDRDFTAIKRFLTEGIDVVFLSGDKAVNEAMAKLRGIEFVYAKSLDGNIEKSIYVDEIRQKYGAETLAYVGDDFYDLSGMSVADLSFCPADASPEVKSFASRVLSSRGGHGVVAELFNLYFSERTTKYPHDFVKSRFC
jgi:3-deoxy-D-manno-octulosonate 8-phosphate phosphatase (KDO 8-P phosphatase)